MIRAKSWTRSTSKDHTSLVLAFTKFCGGRKLGGGVLWGWGEWKGVWGWGRGARGGLTQDEIIWEGSRFVGSREKLPLKWIFGPTIGNMKLFDQIAKLRRAGQNYVLLLKAHHWNLSDTIFPKNMNMKNLSLFKMQWWEDGALNCNEWMEGRGVLPIKADGDGFAQEVRLHLFYSTHSNAEKSKKFTNKLKQVISCTQFLN